MNASQVIQIILPQSNVDILQVLGSSDCGMSKMIGLWTRPGNHKVCLDRPRHVSHRQICGKRIIAISDQETFLVLAQTGASFVC